MCSEMSTKVTEGRRSHRVASGLHFWGLNFLADLAELHVACPRNPEACVTEALRSQLTPVQSQSPQQQQEGKWAGKE